MATKKEEQQEPPIQPARLYRSETNKVIAGIAGGIAEYFNFDPTIIRILFIILTVLHGSGVLIYIVLWFVIPRRTHEHLQPNETIKLNMQEMHDRVAGFKNDFPLQRSVVIIAIILILVGLFASFSSSNTIILFFSQYWPFVLIVIGLLLLTFFRK